MKLGGGRSLLQQGLLDVHVYILKGNVPLKLVLLDVLQDFIQPLVNRFTLLTGQDINMRKHRGVGLAASHVKGSQPGIKGNRLTEMKHQLVGVPGKPAAPGRLFLRTHEGVIVSGTSVEAR